MEESSQQKEVEQGLYKQEQMRRAMEVTNDPLKNTADDKCIMQEDAMFLSYTDPNRNISVGDARAELALSLRNRYKDGEGTDDQNDDIMIIVT